MSGSIKLGDKDRFKDDSTPSFLGQLSFAVTNLVVALLDEAALGAIEPVLQAKRRSTGPQPSQADGRAGGGR